MFTTQSPPGTLGWLLLGVLLLSPAAGAQPSGQSLFDIVDSLTGKDNPARVDAAADALQRRGIEYQVQAFSLERNGKTFEGRNLIVRVEGSQPQLPRIVVGAHLDAAPLRGGGLSRGAIDNAAGTAIVIEVATLVSQRRSSGLPPTGGDPLRHDVDFVLFDLEELGFLGSRHYVEALGLQTDSRDTGSSLSAMVNVDIGTSGKTITYGPASAPGNQALYALAARLCGEQQQSCLEFPQYPPSDERSFQPAGVPNISFAILPRIEAHQLWLRFNGGEDSGLIDGFLPPTVRAIHSPDDTIDKVDAESLSTLSQFLRTYLNELDNTLNTFPTSGNKDETHE